MSEPHPCTFPGCGMIFLRAFELRKHKATHEDPNSVFCCPQCDFITLQRKNLRVHIARHTGEKIHQCPDMITVFGSAGTYEERCEYRTNDPAAVTKHRKRFHGYIPPPNRARPPKATSPCQPPKDRNVVQRYRPYSLPLPVLYRKPPHVFPVSKNPSNNVGDTSPATMLPGASVVTPLPHLWQGNIATYGQPMGANSFHVPGFDSSNSSCGGLVAPYVGTGLFPPYDPSLNPAWLAKYAMGYGSFHATGMKDHPEVAGPSSIPADFNNTQTGREGGMCPEWMVQAGIEGWDQSVLEAHKEFYTFGA